MMGKGYYSSALCANCAKGCNELLTGYCRVNISDIPHNRKQQRWIQAGDFSCTHSDDFLGKSINFISAKNSSDKKSEYNHALVMATNSQTFECRWRVERNNLFSLYEGQKVLVGRYNKITPELFKHAFSYIEGDEGNIYPVHRLFFHAINLAHVFHWKRLVCSEETGKYLFRLGARHHKYFGTTPDMLADEIKRELNAKRNGPKYFIQFEGYLPFNYYVYCAKCDCVYLYPEDDLDHCHFCGEPMSYTEDEKIKKLNVAVSIRKKKILEKREENNA